MDLLKTRACTHRERQRRYADLLAWFSPWRSGDTTTREYRGRAITLRSSDQCLQQTAGEHCARFDDRGDLSFMQRESDGKQVSNDQIDLYRYRADQIPPDQRCLTSGESHVAPGALAAME
ncbi:DUF1481 domain-containing protein [Shigella flexneri]